MQLTRSGVQVGHHEWYAGAPKHTAMLGSTDCHTDQQVPPQNTNTHTYTALTIDILHSASHPPPHTQRTLHKITTTYNNHHHTVQVAKRAHVQVCTLVNAWLVKKKPLPVQAAVGGGSMASHVCTLVNALRNTRKTPVQVAGAALQVQVRLLRSLMAG